MSQEFQSMTNSPYSAQAMGEGAQASVTVQQAPLQPTPAVPPAPPTYFAGRRTHLDALAAALAAGQTTLLTALQGMGGVGKTTTALKLAQEVADRFPGGVFWADLPRHAGDPRPVLRSWALSCGQDLGAEPDLNVLANQVRGLLSARRASRGALLALVDDVREDWLAAAQLLRRALPPDVPLLLTTRDARLAGADVAQAEPTACARLLDAVGYLPLAIELAGKRLARQHSAREIVVELAEAVATRAATTLTLPGHPGLAATFAITYEACRSGHSVTFAGWAPLRRGRWASRAWPACWG